MPQTDAKIDEKKPKKTVTITYNGDDEEFRDRPNEKVRILLDEAIERFRITTNPHLMGLFTTGDVELDDNLTLKAAGVRPGQLLILRVSVARGGGR